MQNLTGTRAGHQHVNAPQTYITPSRPDRPGGVGHSPLRPSPQSFSPARLPGVALSTSGSTGPAESTLDGYRTAPSMPSISDAFDKSSYRADSRDGSDRYGFRGDDHDSDSEESETISDGDSDQTEARDSDTDREVDMTRRHTQGSWAIPVGDIDVHGNERAAILSGNARVYVARARDPNSAGQVPAATGLRPPAHAIFDAAAIATRPLRPNRPGESPTGAKHPARF